MSKWVGRVATLIWFHRRWGEYQPRLRVRILDTEQATPNMDSHNPSGFWYWAKYE